MSLITHEDGEMKSILVLWTPLIRRMFDEADTVDKRTDLQAYVHELIHVDDQAFLDRTFPGGGSAAIQRDDRHGSLLLMVSPAQSEYSATRRSAMIEPSTGFEFVGMLKKVITDVLSDVRRQRRRYQTHEIDLETFWPWVQERGRFIFQSLGYAIGHVDGVVHSDAASPELKEEFRAALGAVEELDLGWLIEQTRKAVLPIYDLEAWTGLEVFDPLIDVGERLLNVFGIWTKLENDALYVHVPLFGGETSERLLLEPFGGSIREGGPSFSGLLSERFAPKADGQLPADAVEKVRL